MNIECVVLRIVKMMFVCENEGKEFGVIVFVEGFVEFFFISYFQGIICDDYGYILIFDVNFCQIFLKLIGEVYIEVIGEKRKINGVQFGYELCCVKLYVFDVMFGS